MTERWGMVIDVNRCVGCQTCTIACKHTNDTPPEVQWRRVLDVETGSYPDVERLFLVTGCQHCAEPPCVPVCPTGATSQRADGLVVMDYDTCIGCGYCAVACPYQARTIVHDRRWYYGEETIQEKAVDHPERRGVAQKCTFCIEKVDEAKEQGLTPGVDLEVTPACSASCIAQAIHFGDFNDAESNVSRLVDENPYFQMHAELGTDPQIKYLYETPAVPGRDPQTDDTDDAHLSDPANPLVGSLQTFWDWRAAMNWCFGGVGSGLAIMTWLGWLLGAVETSYAAVQMLVAGGLLALGLFFVFLKIGRQFRAWRAAMRPQTSWMTRELYAAVVFFPAVLAGALWQHPVALTVAAVAALAFLVCQAKILHMAKGIPNWRMPQIPWMLLGSGPFEGLGLFALLAAFAAPAVAGSTGLAVAGIVLGLMNLALWRWYVRDLRPQGVPPRSRTVLEGATPLLHGVGHALPLALFVVALLWPAAPAAVAAAAGVAAIAGGVFWKFVVITRAAYQQGFALAKFPQRGSGSRAAPRRAGAPRAA